MSANEAVSNISKSDEWDKGLTPEDMDSFRYGETVTCRMASTFLASRVEDILIRHVPGRNYQWEKILDGALRSFTSKLCRILFTPFCSETPEIAHNRQHGVDVPDLSFRRADIERRFAAIALGAVRQHPDCHRLWSRARLYGLAQ